ncbi:hypothetical protein Taro_008638 [Colocasia esculenta]|uniref:Uncharacterized protein n=1 Tax=Colocasia esculenta TaxID=4460 RepID=A0A843U2C3_COLES|nr:hypothetical protein [Colocasia esculenta]
MAAPFAVSFVERGFVSGVLGFSLPSEDVFQSTRWFDWRSGCGFLLHLRWRLLWLALVSTALFFASTGVSVHPPVELSPGFRVRGSGSPRREAFGDDLCQLKTLCATVLLFEYLGLTRCVRTSGPFACHGRCRALSALVGSSWYGAKHGSLSALVGLRQTKGDIHNMGVGRALGRPNKPAAQSGPPWGLKRIEAEVPRGGTNPISEAPIFSPQGHLQEKTSNYK